MTPAYLRVPVRPYKPKEDDVNVIRTPLTSPRIALEAGVSLGIAREPEYVPQPRDPLTREQYDLAHQMSCTKVGCLRCGS